MTKRAYDKIAEGLKEAIAIARNAASEEAVSKEGVTKGTTRATREAPMRGVVKAR